MKNYLLPKEFEKCVRLIWIIDLMRQACRWRRKYKRKKE